MTYNSDTEAKYQAMRKDREMLVRVLRSVLEKAGVREFITPVGLLEKAGLQLQPAPSPQRAFDIEAVIANAAMIREALRPFDSNEAAKTQACGQTQARQEQCGGLSHPAYAQLRDAQGL